MAIQPSLLWTWNRSIDRIPYLFAGILFYLVKFALEWGIARAFGQEWSPRNYFIWPNDRVLKVFELTDSERWFSLTMLAASLPFIWIGIMLSLHRLRAAGLPLILIALFFVPVINLLLFTVLVLLPTDEADLGILVEPEEIDDLGEEEGSPSSRRLAASDRYVEAQLRPLRRMHRSIVRESYWRSGLMALAITVPLSVLGVFFGAQVLQSYGFSLFVGAPFILGMISVLIFGFSRPQPFGYCILVAFAAASLAGLAILVVAIEGLICLIMVAPIAFALTFFGGVVGYVIQARPWLGESAFTITLAMMLLLPSLMAAESAQEFEPAVRAVKTEVIVAAEPAKIWPLVIAFPPLPEPDDWFFKTGIAYPQRAEIQGWGVGATRHCVFSTGTFVEPIETWEPPHVLSFRVSEQPEPMTEWSPYKIHPAHLHHYLNSQKGEFRLERLPDGQTLLTGTTWYNNRMWPEFYWNLWSDYIIHRIHLRVLSHVKNLAESRR